MSALSLSLSDRFSSCLQRLPLLRPAVLEGTCLIDDEVLNERVSALAQVALACLVASLVIPLAYPSVVLVLRLVSIVALAMVPLNIFLTERKVNAMAVAEYMNSDREPSQEARYRLRNNLKAAQLLVSRKGDLNREGFLLLEDISNFRVFKYLVDRGASLTQYYWNGGSILGQLVQMPDRKFLEYALKHGKVAVAEMGTDQQVRLWTALESEKAGSLLKAHGFDLNVRNRQGETPLISLATAYGPENERMEKIKILLQLGADRSLKNVRGQTASELANSDKIRELIDGWEVPTS